MADSVDLSIYGGLLRPPRSAQQYADDITQSQLAQLQLGTAQDQRAQSRQQMQRGQQLQTLMQGMPGATDDQRIAALRGGAFFDQADSLEKSVGERAKTAATVAETKGKTAKGDYDLQRQKYEHVVGGLQQFQQPEDARQWLADSVTKGAMTMPEAQAMMSRVPRDPAGFADWRDRTLMSTMDAGKQAGFIMPDANAKLSATTSTANNKANNDRAAAEGAANRGVQMRGQNMTNDRAKQALDAQTTGYEYKQDADGNLIAVPKKPGAGPIVATPVVDANGKAVGSGSAKMTEDQGKATGWLAQATNAYANMQAALKSTPSAAQPGVNDAIAAIPSFGIGEAIGNKMRGADRQKYMQGTSSLSEALLRAATGAGVNKDEAAQKVKELTPQFGEDSATTAQKMAAIPIYLESLKVRAGPGARQLPGIMERAGAGAPAGFKYLGVEGQ